MNTYLLRLIVPWHCQSMAPPPQQWQLSDCTCTYSKDGGCHTLHLSLWFVLPSVCLWGTPLGEHGNEQRRHWKQRVGTKEGRVKLTFSYVHVLCLKLFSVYVMYMHVL